MMSEVHVITNVRPPNLHEWQQLTQNSLTKVEYILRCYTKIEF